MVSSGGASLMSTQSSGGSPPGRVPTVEVTTRARLGENHSHTPLGAPVSCGASMSGPVTPSAARVSFRSRLACCF